MAGWLKDWNFGSKRNYDYNYYGGYGGYHGGYPMSQPGNFNTSPYNTGSSYPMGQSYQSYPMGQSYPMQTQSYSMPIQSHFVPPPQQYQSRVINVPSTQSVRVPKMYHENVTQNYTVPKTETRTRTVRVPVTKYDPPNPQPSTRNPGP